MSDMRERLASVVEQGLRRYITAEDLSIRHTVTTSDCPVVEVTIGGETFNLTITRARKQP